MKQNELSFARNLVKGKINPLNHPQIPQSIQTNFLKILNDFEE